MVGPLSPKDSFAGKALPPRVIIVDDDEALLGALKFSLETEGYEALAFSRESDLLEDPGALKQAACLVIDYRLEVLDGLGLLATLRRMGVQAPAILVTTDPDERCLRGAIEMGAVIVEKPLMTDALSREIRALIAPVQTRPS